MPMGLPPVKFIAFALLTNPNSGPNKIEPPSVDLFESPLVLPATRPFTNGEKYCVDEALDVSLCQLV